MSSITPFLWYNTDLEEVIAHYSSVFPTLQVTSRMPWEDGKTWSATFVIEWQTFRALNGGPMFQFTEAISWMVERESQQEIDFLWEKLSEGGTQQSCGWVKDRFGMSWQIIPKYLGEIMNCGDAAKIQRVMQALWGMNKPDIAGLMAAMNS